MKFLNKILSFISVFLLLFYQVSFPLAVLAQESTPSASLEQVVESSPSAETTTPTPTPDQPPAPVSDWTDLTDKSATTKENVIVDHLYIAPQNDRVTVKFNKLPESPGRLTIKEVTLTNEQIAETKALSSIAYDISSDMENGTFEYTLTLPTPTTENVEVKASEDGETFVTLGGVTAQTDTLTITGLNHFTIFVITGTISTDEPFIATSFFDESSFDVVINEFVFDPSTGNEWVELYNTSSSDVSLDGWRLEDAGPIADLDLSGTIPAHGMLVFEHESGWLNNPSQSGFGDVITLKNDVGTEISQVTYRREANGTTVNGAPVSSLANINDPDRDRSIGRTTDGDSSAWQAYTTPTKGWFNNAETFDCVTPPSGAPTLTSIASCLEDQGTSTNIGTINNPSATPETEADGALYFGDSEGKIVFEKILNLSDQNTVAILQDLGAAMEMSNGHIKFDSQTADAMAATGAKIYMYGLTFPEKPDIYIKNDAGELLGTNDPAAIDIDNTNYDSEAGELSFTALHFTQFDLPTVPSIPIQHEVSSPSNNLQPTLAWDTVSATPEVSSYEIEIYNSNEENIYSDTTIITTETTYTLEGSLVEDNYTWYVRAHNSFGSSDWSDEGSFTIDTTAPTVTTQLGDGLTDYQLPLLREDPILFGATLIFSEELSAAGKTVVENALTAGADKTLTFRWGSGNISNKLRISTADATTATFANDVVVNVSDIAGNSAELLIVDSALASTQTAPETAEDGSGDATLNDDKPEVVITDPDQEVDITIASGTDNPTIDVSSFITDGTGTIPQITINSDSADVVIPATTVTGPDGWDGVIAAPTVTTDVALPETAGETKTLSTAIEIGFTDGKLSFDKAVRILLPNQAGKRVGYVRTGIEFTEITNTCSADNQATGDALAADGDCKIDVGSDLVIWTKHFTQFAAYTQTASSTSSSSSTQALSPAGGGGTPPVCSDSKPGSAPVLISATGDINSVTLNWSKAKDPVTYYLATYGLAPGQQQYGNPNIGGSGTSSYTVSGLSGGTTYYFKVRAGNGCAPGDFSNELSASPTGAFVEGPAAGFAPGVLGATSEVQGEATPSATQPSVTASPPGEAGQSAFPVRTVVVIVIALLLGFGVFRLLFK